MSLSVSTGRLFRNTPFRRYFLGQMFASFASKMATVAIGWQIYALTNSAVALGMVGLAQFLPTALLVFVGGHVADLYERKRTVQICHFVEGLTAAVLAVLSFRGTITVAEIFLAVVILGASAAFEGPASSALLPGVAPPGAFQKAAALSTAARQLAIISGPALGGLAYAAAPGLPYAIMAAFLVLASVLFGAIEADRPASDDEPPTLRTLFAGIGLVRRSPALLGTISLDLFAVLLGGATALMPIYARDILHTGAFGLGVLRGAPAVGALLMTGAIAHRGIERHAGLRMFHAVIVFGAATIVFAVSHYLWLTLLALLVMGAADTVSMVVREALVQLTTSDSMRGRVGAVENLFTDASNQLGEFESGITAALFGAPAAAVIGGVGTIVVALLWMRLFPTIRAVDRLEIEPEAAQQFGALTSSGSVI